MFLIMLYTLLALVPIDADIFRGSANFRCCNAREGTIAGYQRWKNRLVFSSDQTSLLLINSSNPLAKLHHPSSDQFHMLWLIK